MNTTKRLGTGVLIAAATGALLSAPTAHAEVARTSSAAPAAAADQKCGLYTKGSQDYYKNCADKSERIWVTVNWGYGKQNHFRCIKAGEDHRIGYYLSIHNTYHDSWNC